ncbi:MAG: glutamate--tRNA ligase [Gammaproteobacteria bacterium]|nr:glutamate--tRNA ligase [Gammaproteobacteria bacterium]
MAFTPCKTRFAPSPTGFLHLGNARVALFCALLARHTQGIFLLRIEDTDQGRSEHQYTEALQEDLLWMGLGWQEGPVVEGAQGPYLQSERGEIYHRYFSQLEQDGLAYPCFCSEQELAITRKVQLAAGRAPRYPGTCAALTKDQIETRLAQGLKATLRFRVPRGETVEFEDLVRGPQRFASDDIGDFIIRRADGTPAFFFGNALDDALMGVTHVLRGEDHLSNTPRQIVLLRSLSLRIPEYGHLSLILGSDGTPLSKRHGSHSARELRDAGYFPAALNNYLARLGHSYDNNNFMTLSELAAEFHIGKIGRSPARFDESQLHYWQQQAIAHAHTHELWEWMGPAVHKLVSTAQRDEFIAAIRTNVFLPEHALLWARILYSDPLEWMLGARQVIAEAGTDFFEQALTALQEHPTDFKSLAGKIKQALKINGKALYQPLRAALTGELDGPEMARLLPLLGEERARKRLEAALNYCVSEAEK